jgi:hypothetical protein
LIPNPIRRVLSSIRRHGVQHLLMGGQACVLYGAAEFSRDVDIALLADPDNLERLRAVLEELDAEPVAVPPFDREFLLKGHAVHFRCRHPEAAGIRLDLMAVANGVQDVVPRRQALEAEPARTGTPDGPRAAKGGVLRSERHVHVRDPAFRPQRLRGREVLRLGPQLERQGAGRRGRGPPSRRTTAGRPATVSAGGS